MELCCYSINVKLYYFLPNFPSLSIQSGQVEILQVNYFILAYKLTILTVTNRLLIT